MRSTVRDRLPWLAVLAAILLVLGACDGTDQGDEGPTNGSGNGDPTDNDVSVDNGREVVEGGRVVFGDEQEPTHLNYYIVGGGTTATRKIQTNVLAAAYRILPDFSLEPHLLDGEAEVTEDPFTVTYRIRPEAAWNDGTPLTAADFAFTYETIMAGEQGPEGFEGTWDIISRVGYNLIEDYEIIDDKSIRFEFSASYPPWRLMFDPVLPAHVLDGADFNEVWNDAIVNPETGDAISSGPFQFDSWDAGTQLRLVRNDNYWGEPAPLDELVFRYLESTSSLIQQMRFGSIDMFDPQPQIELIERLEEISDRVTVEVGDGLSLEQVAFNTLVPGLDQEFVRHAIAHAIDRATIVEVLIAPMNPDVEVLDNPIYLVNMPEYEPHFNRYAFDPEAAIALLEDNDCERDDDGIYVCDGVRLSFRIGTTGGNERRELTQQLIQSDLADIGIEIEVDNDEGTEFFGRFNPDECVPRCDFDIAVYGWDSPPDPGASANLFGCDRPQNPMKWCNDEATEALDTANVTLEPDERTELFDRAAQILAEEVPMVPLFQQPQILAWDNSIAGPRLNATTATNFWNSGDWARLE